MQIDSSLPPYYIPKVNDNHQSIEPYSELEDYLDKDDFGNLLNILGQFAGKTSSGLLSFGESVLNNFVFKTKKQIPTDMQFEEEDEEEYTVPGQNKSNTAIKNFNFRGRTQEGDYKAYAKEQALVATQKLATIGKGMWGSFFGNNQ